MCVLSLAPSGRVQSRDDLESACWSNPDGFGYAIHTGRHIIRRRSMVAADLIDRYLIEREQYPDGPALFHARIATSGKVDNSGCHPFYVGGNRKVVLGHNGVLPIPTPGWKSDTRILAEEVIPSHGGIDALRDVSYLAQLEDWIGPGNKLVILSADRSLPSFLIVNEKAGHWCDGSWWSNYSYRWEPKPKTPAADYWWRPDGSDARDLTPGITPAEETDDLSRWWDDVDCPACLFPLGDDSWDDGRCENCWSDLDSFTDEEWRHGRM